MQSEIRTKKKQARQQITEAERKQKSKAACLSIINSDEFIHANKVACFLSMPDEIDTSLIIQTCWQTNKEIYLPIVIEKQAPLLFALYKPTTKLKKGSLSIPIPDIDSKFYIEGRALDLVVMPLVAFDIHRNRIGMGGGFYDRTFAKRHHSFLNGIAYEIQKSQETIPTKSWDIKPNRITTESKNY